MSASSEPFGVTITSKDVLAGTVCLFLGIALALFHPGRGKREWFTSSPRTTVLAGLSQVEIRRLPYPPDVLPGARDVSTPYGSIHVFEWGPEEGEKVLLIHGIATPSISLGDLAHSLVGRGYRVMLFDLFGRGYSDAPNDVTHDARLYMTQILLVLASSELPWTEFHLVGYSLGGCLGVSFARYFPHRVASLTLVAGVGLIRASKVSRTSRLLYNAGAFLLPHCVIRYLVRRRMRAQKAPPAPTAGGGAESKRPMHVVEGDADDDSKGFHSASEVKISPVVAWQILHHQGFIEAFLSTIKHAPICAPQEDWDFLSLALSARRRPRGVDGIDRLPGLAGGKVHFLLGADDAVVVPRETIRDAEEVLGRDGVDYCILGAGHELPMTLSADVASAMEGFWKSTRGT